MEQFTTEDIALLNKKEITPEQAQEQIHFFKEGFPFLEIVNTATTEKGITTIEQGNTYRYTNIWDNYIQGEHKVVKFVPASGAASRMFKTLFEFLDGISDVPETEFMRTFFRDLQKFAFYNDLNEICLKETGKDVEGLTQDNMYKEVIRLLLSKEGLNYGNLPKGLLKFHSYGNYGRTPAEEHLVEGSIYAKSKNGNVNIHFTVSPEHQSLFEKLLETVRKEYESKTNSTFHIGFSEQKPKTDTIAVNPDNTPFRDNGEILFRPGGHGALIENLNDLETDIVFIKNIDNVIPDRLKEEESRYKKILAGYLVETQKRIFDYLNLIDSGDYTHDQLLEILHFTQNELNTKNPEIKYLEDGELVIYLKDKLNRPIRVCGMVKNVGEPGGGPFFTVNRDGSVSLQILESSQIDLNDPQKKEMFQNGTHFNPVDLVCGVKDYQGNKFDLKEYVDKNTGFISHKSKNGKDLKALELPGLWNGAMSDWNTIFIEVPLSTFNPVKTVNDLLREEHQN